MMIVVILLAIASLLQATWMVILQTFTKRDTVPKNIILSASGFGALGLLVYSIINHGGTSHLLNLPSAFWWWAAASVAAEICLAYLFANVLANAPSGLAAQAPIFAPILAIFTAYFLGVDSFPALLAVAGILAIAVGVYVLHFNPATYGWKLLAPFTTMWLQRSVWLKYALGFALVAPFAFPLMKQSVALSDVFIAPGIILFLGWGVFYLAKAFTSGDMRRLSRLSAPQLTLLLGVIALLFAVNNLLVAIGYSLGEAAVVGSLKRLDAPIALLIIYFVPLCAQLRNEDRAQGGHIGFRLVGSLITFSGALLIGLGR